MIRDDLRAYVGIISHQRSQNVQAMEALVGAATWFVGAGEGDEYRDQGATQVIESGGLCRSRNAILEEAWGKGYAGLELSDDLKGIKEAYMTKDGKKKARDVSFETAVDSMHDALFQTGAMMAGVAPTGNPFYWDPAKPIHPKAFIVGDMILVRPCELFFDEDMRLKEDYDYTIQHVLKYGRVARCNDILAQFSHRTNSGGAVAARTPELEQEMIDFLKKKWGTGVIRDNAKRPDEILLNLRSIS